jgi:predicted PurR-regulated permease PerM
MEEAVPAEAQGSTTGPSPAAALDRRLRPPTLRVSLLLGALLVAGTVLYLGRDALGPFILGLFLVYLLDPLVSVLHRRARLPRWLGVVVLYLAIVLGAVLIVRVTVPPLVEQISNLIKQLPSLMQTWIGALEQTIANLQLLPADVRDELIKTLEEFSASLTGTGGASNKWLSELMTWLLQFDIAGPVARAVSAFFAYLVIPIFVFYLLKDRPALVASIHGALPAEWRPDIRSVTTIIDRVFARWLRGQLLLGLVVGVATFIGLEALAVTGIAPAFGNFAILLALISGILELVPIIGPIISAIPIALVGATDGIQGAIAGIAVAFAVQQIENNFLVPKIQGDATDLHPSIVIAGIVIGGSIGGILGAILALPVSAAFRDVIRYLMRRLDPVPMAVEPALAAALRPADWRSAASEDAGPADGARAAPAAREADDEPRAEEPPEGAVRLEPEPEGPRRPGGDPPSDVGPSAPAGRG